MANLKALDAQLKKNVPATSSLNIQLEQEVPNYAAERILSQGIKSVEGIFQQRENNNILSIKNQIAQSQNKFKQTYLTDPTNFSIPEKREKMYEEFNTVVEANKNLISDAKLPGPKQEELLAFLEGKVGQTGFTMAKETTTHDLDRMMSEFMTRQGEMKLLTEASMSEDEFTENVKLELDNIDGMIASGLVGESDGVKMKLETVDKREASFLKRKIGDVITNPDITMEQKTVMLDKLVEEMTGDDWLEARANLYAEMYNVPLDKAKEYAEATKETYKQSVDGMNNELKGQLRQIKFQEEQQMRQIDDAANNIPKSKASQLESTLVANNIPGALSVATGTEVSASDIFNKEAPSNIKDKNGNPLFYTQILYNVTPEQLDDKNYVVDVIPVKVLKELGDEAKMLEDDGRSEKYIYENVYMPYIETMSNGNELTKKMLTRELTYKGHLDPLAIEFYNKNNKQGAETVLGYKDGARPYQTEVANINVLESRNKVLDKGLREKVKAMGPEQRRTLNEQVIGYMGNNGLTPPDGSAITTGYIVSLYENNETFRKFVDSTAGSIGGITELRRLRPDMQQINKMSKANAENEKKVFLNRYKTSESAGSSEPVTKTIVIDKGRTLKADIKPKEVTPPYYTE